MTLLQRFETFEIPAPDFHHEDHIRVAYEMLDQYDFVEACARYAKTIRAMAESVGALEKFNTTITIAFMSLVAERKAEFVGGSADAFLSTYPELLDKTLLSKLYSDGRLHSASARQLFLLPDK